MRKALATLALVALVAPPKAKASDELLTEYFNHSFKPCTEIVRMGRNMPPLTNKDITKLWDMMLAETISDVTYANTAWASNLPPSLRIDFYNMQQMRCVLGQLMPNRETHDAVLLLVEYIVCRASWVRVDIKKQDTECKRNSK